MFWNAPRLTVPSCLHRQRPHLHRPSHLPRLASLALCCREDPRHNLDRDMPTRYGLRCSQTPLPPRLRVQGQGPNVAISPRDSLVSLGGVVYHHRRLSSSSQAAYRAGATRLEIG